MSATETKRTPAYHYFCHCNYILMKTNTLLCLAVTIVGCCILPADGFGQMRRVNKPIILLGVKGNLQAAGIANQNNYGQNEMDYGLHAGIGLGLVATYVIKPRIALLTEVSYQTSGQKYDDRFKGRHFQKDISFSLISMPLLFRYQVSSGPAGYGGVGTESKPLWYVLGGLQVNRMLSPSAKYRLDGTETDFLSFVLEGGNRNQGVIEAMGPPDTTSDLYTGWDVMFAAGGGFLLSITPAMYLTTEIRGGIGLTDMNAEPWRLPNNANIYEASRHSYLGLHAGIHVLIISP